jgi:hypothetical protein
LASSQLLNDFVEEPFEITYFYKRVREVKKQSKFYYRHVLDALLSRHHQALLRILQNNDFELDERYFDAVLKQKLVQQLFNLQQGTEQNLRKLGIHPHFMQQMDSSVPTILTIQNTWLVFNLVSLKLEAYNAEAIQANQQYLLPLKASANAVVELELNAESYVLTMNDRGIHKLVKVGEALALDQSLLIFKRYPEFYQLSYKNLTLSCDDHGQGHFIENHADEQTKLQLID